MPREEQGCGEESRKGGERRRGRGREEKEEMGTGGTGQGREIKQRLQERASRRRRRRAGERGAPKLPARVLSSSVLPPVPATAALAAPSPSRLLRRLEHEHAIPSRGAACKWKTPEGAKRKPGARLNPSEPAPPGMWALSIRGQASVRARSPLHDTPHTGVWGAPTAPRVSIRAATNVNIHTEQMTSRRRSGFAT